MPEGERPLRILLAAHPYVIHDNFVGSPLIDMLREMETCILFADRHNHEKALEKSFEFSDTLPWIVNREIIGTILDLYDQIDGIVLVSAFLAGPTHDQRCPYALHQKRNHPFRSLSMHRAEPLAWKRA